MSNGLQNWTPASVENKNVQIDTPSINIIHPAKTPAKQDDSTTSSAIPSLLKQQVDDMERYLDAFSADLKQSTSSMDTQF